MSVTAQRPMVVKRWWSDDKEERDERGGTERKGLVWPFPNSPFPDPPFPISPSEFVPLPAFIISPYYDTVPHDGKQ